MMSNEEYQESLRLRQKHRDEQQEKMRPAKGEDIQRIEEKLLIIIGKLDRLADDPRKGE